MLSRHVSFFLLAALGGGFAAGCAGMGRDLETELDDGGLGGDFVSDGETTLVLAPTSTYELKVRYAGPAPGGKEVEFAVVPLEDDEGGMRGLGAAADGGVSAPSGGSLSPSAVLTDDAGRAVTTLTVGSTPGMFRVRARMAGIAPLYFVITVSDALYPKVRVNVKYDGLRPLATRSATAIPKLGCDQAMKSDRTDGLVQTFPQSDADAGAEDDASQALTFAIVPGQSYAIVAWGRDDTNAELATGCEPLPALTSQSVSTDTPRTVTVTIQDRPMRFEGDFAVELALKLDASMARLSSTTQAQVAALLPSGTNGEARAYLAAVHDALTALQEADKASKVEALASNGQTLSALADVLTTNQAGYAASGAALSQLVTSVGKNLSVLGGYGVGGGGASMTLTVGSLVTRSDDGALAFNLMTGVSNMVPSATIVGDYDDARATVNVQTLSLSLPLGTYAGALLDALGKDDPSKWFVSRFSGAAGCSAVASWLASEPSMQDGDAPLCDQACGSRVCLDVLGAVVAAARDGYASLNDHASISLTGGVSVHDRMGDESVDDVGPSPLSGNWGKDPTTDVVDAVSGTLKMQENSLAL